MEQKVYVALIISYEPIKIVNEEEIRKHARHYVAVVHDLVPETNGVYSVRTRPSADEFRSPLATIKASGNSVGVVAVRWLQKLIENPLDYIPLYRRRKLEIPQK